MEISTLSHNSITKRSLFRSLLRDIFFFKLDDYISLRRTLRRPCNGGVMINRIDIAAGLFFG